VVALDLIGVPAGQFRREVSHKGDYLHSVSVIVTRPFYLGKYEVTRGQWAAVMGAPPACHSTGGLGYPATCVSWADCHEFIKKLNARHPGFEFRLPTEAEWERAHRQWTAGAHRCNVAFRRQNSTGTIQRVGTPAVSPLGSNALGLHDMTGNVSEWCADWHERLPRRPQIDPIGPDTGTRKVFLGGQHTEASGGRAAAPVEFRASWLGFRLACSTVPSSGPERTDEVVERRGNSVDEDRSARLSTESPESPPATKPPSRVRACPDRSGNSGRTVRPLPPERTRR
jgi:formylglycine-generating enzyme required for sulfatase activity